MNVRRQVTPIIVPNIASSDHTCSVSPHMSAGKTNARYGTPSTPRPPVPAGDERADAEAEGEPGEQRRADRLHDRDDPVGPVLPEQMLEHVPGAEAPAAVRGRFVSLRSLSDRGRSFDQRPSGEPEEHVLETRAPHQGGDRLEAAAQHLGEDVLAVLRIDEDAVGERLDAFSEVGDRGRDLGIALATRTSPRAPRGSNALG